MTGRIEHILDQPIPEMWCGTFLSISNRILRRHCEEAGLEKEFAILDSDDQLRIIKRILKELDVDEDQWAPEKVRWQINTWKDEALRSKDVDDQGDFNIEMLKRIYTHYENYMAKENLLDFAEKKTIRNTKLQINLALNYGSKKEIVYAFNKLKKRSKISENDINNNLYTKNIPDPEILIRTGNTQRLSNFLLWQAAYTEIFFEKKLWPDFKDEDLNKIMKKFSKIKRNFGKI